MRVLLEEAGEPDERRADAVVRSVRRLREGQRPMTYARWAATIVLIVDLLEEAVEEDPGDDA
jgi:hypothetical protein